MLNRLDCPLFLLAGYAKQFNSTRCCLINLYRTELLSFPSFHLQLLPDPSIVGPTSGSASTDSKKCQCWSPSTWWRLGKSNMRGHICYKTKPKYMLKDFIPWCLQTLKIINRIIVEKHVEEKLRKPLWQNGREFRSTSEHLFLGLIVFH